MTLAFSTEQTRLSRFCASSNLGVDAAALAVRQGLDAARLAEVDATRELAQDHDVEAAHQLGLERGTVGKRLEHLGRAQIGEQAEILAQAQKRPLGLRFEREDVVLRPADSTEEDGIGGQRLLHHRVGAGHPVPVVGGAADQILLGLEADALALGEPVEHPPCLAHDLGADAVARQEEDAAERGGVVAQERHHATPRCSQGCAARCFASNSAIRSSFSSVSATSSRPCSRRCLLNGSTSKRRG
jgi:hypothetical protein